MVAPSKADIRATYERIAVSFAATRREPWPEVRSFIDRLPPESVVLDVGCGNGRHTKTLAAGGHSVVAVDFSRDLLTIGRHDVAKSGVHTRVAWVEADATTLPVHSDSFDACVCVALLHHLPDREARIAALEEIGRILRPDSPVLLSVWARDQKRFEAVPPVHPGANGDVIVPWTMPDGTSVPRFYHLFREGELERMIIEAGLHGERFFRGAGNWFGLARKHG